jgi:predicted transposase/invertase (TIGR01784 family)
MFIHATYDFVATNGASWVLPTKYSSYNHGKKTVFKGFYSLAWSAGCFYFRCMARKRKDILLKSVIEDFPEPFLRFFYKDAEKLFDLTAGFESLETELRQIAPDSAFMQDSVTVDKLLKCGSVIKDLQWFLLLIEVQGYRDSHFADRIYKYFSRLVDKYGKRVMVLVIYTDIYKSYHPAFADYDFANTKNRFDFETYKVLDQDEKVLAADDNFIALIVLTVLLAIKQEIKGTDEDLLASKILLVKNLKNRNLLPEDEAKILTFIRLYALFENPEMNLKFETEIESIINKTPNMGIIEFAIQDAAQEAREVAEAKAQEAWMEKNISFVRKLLMKGKLTLEEIADAAEVSLDFVRSIKMQLH